MTTLFAPSRQICAPLDEIISPSRYEPAKSSVAWKNSIRGSCNRRKNDADLIFFILAGKPWESTQGECKVNTFIDELRMWPAPDQPWERLSARLGGVGGGGEAVRNPLNTQKEPRRNWWGEHVPAGGGNKICCQRKTDGRGEAGGQVFRRFCD